MRVFIQLFLISVVTVSCAHNGHVDELSRRANYDLGKETKRTKAKTAEIYIFPHEMPNGDRFKGGMIDAVIERENWKR
jgi:hypothetical protein